MAKRQKVEGSFSGLCTAGDIVRVYYAAGPGSATVLVRHVDHDGDIICEDYGAIHDGYCVTASCCNGIQVIRAAPPKVERSFGDSLRVTIKGDSVDVNGERVPYVLLCAVAKTVGWDCSEDGYTDSALHTAWTRHDCQLTPTGFRAGCARCTAEQLEEALTWVFETLGE